MRSREIRKEAVEAQNMAMQAHKTAEKAAWLCVAQGWASLLRQRTADAGAATQEQNVSAYNKGRRRRKGAQKLRTKVRRGTARQGVAAAR